MADIKIYQPDLGIDSSRPINMIDDRGAADGTQNVDFDSGVVTVPAGFAKLSCASPLVAGKMILGMCQYTEIDGRANIVAVTNTKVFQHNIVTDTWDEITGDTLDANPLYPISFASILHQDSVGGKYQHLLICDGGRSDILRWAGNGETLAELVGGNGYNGAETSHRAMQVCAYQNRTILISPYEYSGSVWLPNPSRIRWPQLGRLESESDKTVPATDPAWDPSLSGAGQSDLIDTGDQNVWASLLGSTLIVYQKHSIWQLRYVGGTTVFTPDILVSDLGLLAPGLHATTGSMHYFVGNDLNIYSYAGGSMLEDIGGSIADLFKRDIDVRKVYNCRMMIGAEHKYLWVFVVLDSGGYATRAYKYNLRTGSWTVRDFSNIGVTAGTLLSSAIYTVGSTYADAVTTGTMYAEAAAGSAITQTETPTATTWNAAGKVMTGTGSTWNSTNPVVPGDIVKVNSGTNATAGYYVVESVASDLSMTLASSIGSSPSNVDYDIFAADGTSYDEMTEQVRVDEKLTIGDSDGYVFKEDADIATDNGEEPVRYYVTKEFDGGEPDMNKRIDGLLLDCKGDYITIECKVDGGEWIPCS